MIILSLEYYPRHVWSTLLSSPVQVTWNDLAFLQTLTLVRFQRNKIKLLWRLRYWKDRSRLGFEMKYTRTLYKGPISKFVIQKKIGIYIYCEDIPWTYFQAFLEMCGWKTRFKIRQSFVARNLRWTLDNKNKLEIKIHKKPVF